MKTVFLLSALACATLAAPGHHHRHGSDEAERIEIREKKSPTFKHPVAVVPVAVAAPIYTPVHQPHHQPLLHHGLGYKKPHLGFREANESAEQHLVQSKETENQQKVEESIHMSKAAFDNLEHDLNNIENREKSADIEKARQALEDARKSFAELQSMRIASSIVDEPAKIQTTQLKKTETERMAQWKGHKETVQRNEEGSAPNGHKAMEMEESASNNKELFRAPDELNNLPNHQFQKNSEQLKKSNIDSKSSIEVAKNAEDVEKVKQQTKNLEIMKAKNTFNRNSASLTHDLPEKQNVQNINMEKKVNLDEHPRASTQFLEVPKQHKDAKPQVAHESRPMMPVDNNTNQKNRESSLKSAEPIDSKWSSTQNKEQVVQGKSAEEHTVDSHGNQFVATHERANQDDLPWRPPGSKIDMRNEEGEFMRETKQWKHLPQSDMRSAYGSSYGIGGAGIGGASIGGAGIGGAGAIGVFPNAHVSNCAIPLLLSCSPNVVSGSLGKSYGSSYGSSAGAYGTSASAYRSGDQVHQPSKRDAKNLNRVELSKSKRTASKDYPQYRAVSKMH